MGFTISRNPPINVAGFDVVCFAFGISNNSFLAHGMFIGLTQRALQRMVERSRWRVNLLEREWIS